MDGKEPILRFAKDAKAAKGNIRKPRGAKTTPSELNDTLMVGAPCQANGQPDPCSQE